jgi:hypothetical protein
VLGRFVASLHLAAYVTNPTLDILATSALARALFSRYERLDNVARMVFCDPESRPGITNWDLTAQSIVSALRSAANEDGPSANVWRLIAQLSASSVEFRSLWSMHPGTVSGDPQWNTVFHPDVGKIETESVAITHRGPRQQQLVILTTQPGSPSADSLALLGTLHAGDLNAEVR